MRLPRLYTVFVALFLTCSYAITGTLDYQDKLSAVEERKTIKKQVAPIWSQKCQRKGMDVMASKADKGPWKINCIQKRVIKT